MENIILYFVQSIPEIMGLIAFSLVLARVSLKWDRIIVLSLLLAVVVYIIKILPLPGGIHLIVTILLIFGYINLKTHVSAPKSFIVSFSSLVFLAILEYVLHEGVISISGLGMEELMVRPMLWASIGVFQSLIFIGIAVLISKARRIDEGAWKK